MHWHGEWAWQANSLAEQLSECDCERVTDVLCNAKMRRCEAGLFALPLFRKFLVLFKCNERNETLVLSLCRAKQIK